MSRSILIDSDFEYDSLFKTNNVGMVNYIQEEGNDERQYGV